VERVIIGDAESEEKSVDVRMQDGGRGTEGVQLMMSEDRFTDSESPNITIHKELKYNQEIDNELKAY